MTHHPKPASKPARRFARMPKNPAEPLEAPAPATPIAPDSVNNVAEQNGATKIGQVLALLSRDDGATLAELVAATGWQPHTTRAALTGLRKKGHPVTSDKVGAARRYRVVKPQ